MAQAKVVNKLEIVGDDGNVFILKATEVSTGKVRDAQTYHGEKPLKPEQVGATLVQEFKAQGTLRAARQSLLGMVMQWPTLEGYKGKGDVKAGSTSKEFKAAVRSAEESVLRELVKKGHMKVPAIADKDDKDYGNEEAAFQRFATSIREDKNYSNVKATVMKYFAFVGAAPITKSGYLVPVPVMQAEVQRVLDANKEPTDSSFAGKLRALADQLEKETISLEDASKAAPIARMLYSTLEGIVNHYKEMAEHAAESVSAQAQKITEAAKAKAEEKPKSTAKA